LAVLGSEHFKNSYFLHESNTQKQIANTSQSYCLDKAKRVGNVYFHTVQMENTNAVSTSMMTVLQVATSWRHN
jgi:hypothetical protein